MKTILVGGDPELFEGLEQSVCCRESFRVLPAADGRGAVLAVENERPDLVLLDLDLPVLGGDGCCRRIKADPRLCGIPVVLVVGGEPGEGLVRCLQAGCDYIVFAPVSQHDIEAISRRFLNRRPRKTSRASTRLSVVFGSDPRSMQTGSTLNLSSGGLFISTDAPADTGTPLYLSLTLPHRRRRINCRTTVVWARPAGVADGHPAGMGVKFLLLTPPDLAAIQEHVLRSRS